MPVFFVIDSVLLSTTNNNPNDLNGLHDANLRRGNSIDCGS